MNGPDPMTPPAAQAAGHRGLADTDEPAHRETGDGTGWAAAEPIRTAGTCRPLEEVAGVMSLPKETGRHPDRGHQALRAAAVARPVHEVRESVALLDDAAGEGPEKDVTLRAAAVGRPVEGVALLVGILRTDGADGAPAGPARPYGRPEAAPAQGAGSRHRDPVLDPAARSASARDRRLRRVLRRPVAAVLLFCGVLHLPADPVAVPAAGPAVLLPLVAAVLGLGFGMLLAVRGGDAAWRAVAAAAVGVVALHVAGGVSGWDPLRGAVSAPLPWAGAATVLCAAVAALLAGLALAAAARPGARG
ncbi:MULTISPECIES: hypothetical protein [Streptomyces]|uniref:hypothetical protein n=1 Tax=Streptomyces TaxID=1883 RepID=UPI0016747FD1|nr:MULTISPECIES: hypothetical protein [Streptomyces]MBD3575757.1 hypothetical protein [Streptomyces sp. KD18]GGT25815.1 hypothetical protein GCM10010286_59060 [Streptomyces toxytricini]